MAGDELSRCRREVLAQVQGEILAIGFGTGLNLPHYPSHVHKLTAIEVKAQWNIKKNLPVPIQKLEPMI